MTKHIHKWRGVGVATVSSLVITVIAVAVCEKCGEFKSKRV